MTQKYLNMMKLTNEIIYLIFLCNVTHSSKKLILVDNFNNVTQNVLHLSHAVILAMK